MITPGATSSPPLRVVHAAAELRTAVAAARRAGKAIGLVPTMGALQAGHLSPADPPRREAGGGGEGGEGRRGAGQCGGAAGGAEKVFTRAAPAVGFCGGKNYEQCLVGRGVDAELALPIDIRVCPIVREPDGLAMSSRNVY